MTTLKERVSRRAAMSLAGLSAVSAALVGTTGRSVKRAVAAPGNDITGSWEVQTEDTVQLALQTFTIDGGFIAAHGLHLSRTPSHGAWVRTGQDRFAAELVNYGFENGALATRRVTRLDITLDPSGNRYTAPLTSEDFDLAGNSLGTTASRSTATRIGQHLPG